MKKKGLVSLGLAMVLALASGCGGAGGVAAAV